MGRAHGAVGVCLLLACQELLGGDFGAARTDGGGGATPVATGSTSSHGEEGGAAAQAGVGSSISEAGGGSAAAAGGVGGDIASGSSGTRWPSGGSSEQTGGSSGKTGTGGDRPAQPSNPDWAMPSVLPFCFTRRDGLDPLALEASTSLGAYASLDGVTQITLFAAAPRQDVVGVKWIYQQTAWVDWACFDAVPAPSRLAGMLPLSGLQEVFVVTLQGALLSRRMGTGGWCNWAPFMRPSSTALARDIAAWQGRIFPARLLIATSEGLYTSQLLETTADDRNIYEPWRLVSAETFDRVALCGDAEVLGFALANGALYTLSFGEELSLRRIEGADASRLEDIDCAPNPKGEMRLYATREGSLLSFDVSEASPSGVATVLKAREDVPTLSSVTAVPRYQKNPFLFATTKTGAVLLSLDGGRSWLPDGNWPNQ